MLGIADLFMVGGYSGAYILSLFSVTCLVTALGGGLSFLMLIASITTAVMS